MAPVRVIVVYEDGDRSSRVELLAEELRACVKSGSLQYHCGRVEVQQENALQ